MVHNAARVVDQDRGVVDTAYARLAAFIKPHVREYLISSARLPQQADFWPVDKQAGAREAGEEGVVVNGRGQGGPERIRGDVGFRKDNEVGAVRGGFANEGDGLLDGLGGVEEDGGDVAGWWCSVRLNAGRGSG